MKNRLSETVNAATKLGFRRFSTACREKFQNLKEAITTELTSQFAGILGPNLVRQMVNEADALAALSGYPTLFLPVLAEEKVLVASRWQSKQRLIQERSSLRAA